MEVIKKFHQLSMHNKYEALDERPSFRIAESRFNFAEAFISWV